MSFPKNLALDGAFSSSSTRISRSRGAILWAYLVPIFTLHLLAILAVAPWLFSWAGVVALLVGIHVYGNLGINLCYHRLLTHRSFAVPKWLEYTLATFALCCMQDTPTRWVATHRLHHNHSDEEGDPHSPLDDFVWSHIGWLFRKSPAVHDIAVYQKYARDLLSDPFYFFLEKRPYWVGIVYFAHAAVYFLAGLVAGRWYSGDWPAGLQLGASLVVWGVIVRTVAVWHITWSVNSLTHTFGYRNYATSENSRNNWLVALVSAGEGWHNNHHQDPASASVQHRWWEFDLTYYTIQALAALGLASRVTPPRHIRREERG
ncbi:Fatty acid desaturase [Anatilimnocola aggregata]|uniref:Fatty acid desaturase n=1 Tax=Anatilimnocola aggregata TaxID=2528021 RepID=A0A517YHM0_9BACT|nr:fatty acid desaturase [Anatilimnocola aggregata]QDU29709.1 Fatty acid desaturase [Anatilimnocola aggregata]